ncbi:MAG: sugar phosphate isomerase/epimerase [Gemmataceae bacterium]|nr:sugar phosphate isomerase/epimerase [Gemmataceae bacterium]
MIAHFTRREFIASTVVAAALPAWAQNFLPKLAVSTWSFHNYFPNTRYGKPEFKLEDWSLEKVIGHAAKNLDIRNFELSSAHLASLELPYLEELKKKAAVEGWKFIHLSDNMRGVNLARADAGQREMDFQRFVELIRVANKLAIPSLRVNTGAPEKPDWNLDITIEQYRRLAKLGKEQGVEIIIENHFGISADPVLVEKIIKAVGENISSCPDFGLFKEDKNRWPGLEIMFRNARRMCSAKFHGFDAQGKPKDFDVERCYKVLKQNKFPGWISLEYEGPLEPTAPLATMKKLVGQWLG